MPGAAPIPWCVNLLRLTVFRDRATETFGLFERLSGNQPAQQNRNPQSGLAIERGTVLGWPGEVRTQFDRVDVLVSAPPPHGLEDFPTLGETHAAISKFAEAVTTDWLPKLDGVKRVCFGATAALRVESEEGANSHIRDFVRMEFDPKLVSDLVIQINRHSTSTHLPGLRLNHLYKCAAVKQVSIVFDTAAASHPRAVELSASSIELDFNSDAAQADALPSDQVAPIFSELVERAQTDLRTGTTQ